ncbi:MAG TPA: YihY/virulence factor BrkB family protein [Mycobacteriales bacterium]
MALAGGRGGGGRLATPREVLPAARRAMERALSERQRLRETVRESVRPVTRHRPVNLIRQTLSKAWQDRVLGLSAEAAFWQLLSLPALVLALVGSLGYLGDLIGPRTITSIQRTLLSVFSQAFTPDVVDALVRPTVEEVLNHGRADVISIGFLLSLWAGSSATSTFVNTITIAYGMRELRGAVRSRLIALWLYIASVAVGLVVLPLMVLGPGQLAGVFPEDLRADVSALTQALYWPALGGLLLVGLTSFYHLALPRRLPWHRGLPGAMFAMVIFLLGSAGLRDYVGFVVSRAFIYRALAAPIAALLFLFLLALAVLLGAELNATIEQMWPSRPTRHQRRRQARRQERELRRAIERSDDEPN